MSRYYERDGLLVPSAVLREEFESQSPEFLAVVRRMIEEPIELNLVTTTWYFYLTLGGLQLATAHPDLPEHLRQGMTEVGQVLQGQLAQCYPEIADMLEAGWHRDMDVVRPKAEP